MTIEYRCSECSNLLPTAFSTICANCGKNFAPEKSLVEPKNTTNILDPNNPAWGFRSSLVLWLLSVLLVLFAQVPALATWMLWMKFSGQVMPSKLDIQEHPEIAVFGVIFTFISQLITIALSYRFITRTSNNGFLSALGWYWPKELNLLKTVGLSFLIFVSFVLIASLLPNKESEMQKLIESSMAARLSIAFVAVVGAPFVEELVYRGILYSGLCRDFGRNIAIIGVSVLFLLVHVPQYWGAWGGILGIAFLSIVLTLVRAYSGSLLPSFVIHLIFNSIQVSLIIAQGLLNLPKNS
ncbi:MAG: CAAX amino terminal protease [bacterium]|nr:MAG: CAAX amino terminal protease [bacterium]